MTDVEERDGISRAAQTITGNGTFSQVLEVRGGKQISGIVDKTSSYDVQLVWLENDGTVIATEDVATGVTGQTEFNETWHTVGSCRFEITDNSGSEEDAAVTVNVI
jgi:hypothetical protein